MSRWLSRQYPGYRHRDLIGLHVEYIDDDFVVQHEPGIDVSLAGQQFRLRAFDAPDMYFGALNVAGIDAQGNLHALADTRRHGSQYVSPAS